MTHAAPEGLAFSDAPPANPTISDAELTHYINFLDDRLDMTKREVEALEHLMRTAAARMDAPLLKGA